MANSRFFLFSDTSHSGSGLPLQSLYRPHVAPVVCRKGAIAKQLS